MQWLTIERHNRTCAKLSSLCSVCFVRRLVVLLPNFVVVIERIKSLWNHSFWPSNITDIDRDGWNITYRWCQDSYIFPRDNIFPQCCALRENITLLTVHRNVIFHDRPGQYLYIISFATSWQVTWQPSWCPAPASRSASDSWGRCPWRHSAWLASLGTRGAQIVHWPHIQEDLPWLETIKTPTTSLTLGWRISCRAQKVYVTSYCYCIKYFNYMIIIITVIIIILIHVL